MRTIRLLILVLFSVILPQNIIADDIYAVTSSKKLNVRSAPSKSANIITQLNPGEEVRCISTDGSWKQIQLGNGRYGYAAAEFLTYRRHIPEQINSAPTTYKEKGGWWTTPTGMIIILIIVSGGLSWLLIEVFDVEGFVAKIIVAILSGSYMGGIAGLLSWWIFDNFWTPYLIIMGLWLFIMLIKSASNYFSDSSSNDFDHNDWNTYGSGTSSYSSSSSYSQQSYSHGYDDEDDYGYDDGDDDYEEERERERRQEESNRYLRDADDYYSKYEYYKRLAEEAESSADTEDRYADDYEWRAREFNDSSYASQASSCRSNAARYRYKARQHESEADRYYNLYREYKDRAR